jgi:hypothetical protein
MAHILIEVDKGQCNYCFGSGWEPKITEQHTAIKNTLRLPTQFDIGKCSVCGGTGRRIEIE